MKGNWILIEAYIGFSLQACLKKGLPLHGDIGRCKGTKEINSKGNMKVQGLAFRFRVLGFIRLGVGALALGSRGARGRIICGLNRVLQGMSQ